MSDLGNSYGSDPMDQGLIRKGEVFEIVDECLDMKESWVDDDDNNADPAIGGAQTMDILPDDSIQGFFEHTAPVYCIAAHPRVADLVCTGGGDDVAFEWSIVDGERRMKVDGHTDSVIGIGYSFDGALIATGGMDGIAMILAGHDGTVLHKLEGPNSEIEWIQWHPLGPVLAVGSADGTSWLWHITPANATLMQVFSGHEGSVCAGTFSGSGGKFLCTSSEDGSVRVWSAKTGQVVTHIKAGPMYHNGPVVAMSHHPTQPIVLTGSQDGTARWAHTETGKELGKVHDHQSAVEAVAFAHVELGKNWAASGGMDGSICIIDIDRAKVRGRFQHDDGVVKLVWLRRQPYLLCSCSLDGTVRLWDTRRAGEALCVFKGHQGPVYDLAITCDERLIVSVAEDHTALVFPIDQQIE